MRLLLSILPFFLLIGISAQDPVAPDPLIEKVNGLAEALAGARNDQARDSINLQLKHAIKKIFEADDAPALDLTSLKLSRVDAPDGSFRLITWNVPRENGSHLYEGILLHLKGKNRSLFELRDMTGEITSPEVPELGPDRWYGALYYEVVPVKKGAKTYYTLLGWKGHDRVETRKVIDVLHFKGSRPVFGAPLFGEGRLKRNRKVYAYSFRSTMMLRYDADMQRIVLDHLSPSRADLEGQFAFYGPDMSYDAFRWEKGQWIHERDIDARDRSRNGKPYNAPPKPPSP